MRGFSNFAIPHSKCVKPSRNKSARKKKNPANVEDVWKRGYGDGIEITWLFLGLARAAGFEASGVMVSERSKYFFNPNLMDPHKLDSNVVVVKLNGKTFFATPALHLLLRNVDLVGDWRAGLAPR